MKIRMPQKRGMTDISIYIINRTISGEGMEETGVGELLVSLINTAIRHKPKRHLEIRWVG